MAVQFGQRGYPKASSFIARNATFMVTFADLALEDIKTPYTDNHMECLYTYQLDFAIYFSPF